VSCGGVFQGVIRGVLRGVHRGVLQDFLTDVLRGVLQGVLRGVLQAVFRRCPPGCPPRCPTKCPPRSPPGCPPRCTPGCSPRVFSEGVLQGRHPPQLILFYRKLYSLNWNFKRRRTRSACVGTSDLWNDLPPTTKSCEFFLQFKINLQL
jgi:hypothetical protein